MDGATLDFFLVDNIGMATGSSVATTTTFSDGSFTATLPMPRTDLIIQTSGGSYRDESDQQGLRTISLGGAEGFEVLLSASEESIAITPFSAAILTDAREGTNGTDFMDVFTQSREEGVARWGFDVQLVEPSDPMNPDTSQDEVLNYALMLGGAANLINSAAIQMGLATPNFNVIDAFIRDLSDGILDGKELETTINVMVGGSPVAFPNNLDLVAGVLRFRNNNFALYPDVFVFLENPFGVSGEAEGLVGSGLELQLNGERSVVINSDGEFEFPGFLADGSSFEVSILNLPSSPAQQCEVLDGEGTIEGESHEDVFVVCNAVLPLYLDNGVNWNDYVVNDGPDDLNASDSPCTGGETGDYFVCIHGGEYRSVVIPGYDSCSGVSSSDALGAFEWGCLEDTGGAFAVSTGLKEDKYLSDLIDWTGTPAWKANSVTSSGPNGTKISAASVWWGNPVSVDNDGGNLNPPGSVYVATVDAVANYAITGDRVALVFEPGVTQTGAGTGSNSHIVEAIGRKFIWVEGTADPSYDDWGVFWSDVDSSVIRNVRLVGSDIENSFTDDGIHLEAGSQSNLIVHSLIKDIRNRGVEIYEDSSYNTWYDLEIDRTRSNYGIDCRDSEYQWIERLHSAKAGNRTLNFNRCENTTVHDSQAHFTRSNYGMNFSSSPNTTVANTFISNSGSNYGLYFSGSPNGTVVNVTSVHSGNHGINISGSENTRVINSTSVNGRQRGIQFSSTSDNSVLLNHVSVNNNSAGLSVDATNMTIFNFASAHNNSDGYDGSTTGGNSIGGILKIIDNRWENCDTDSLSELTDTTCQPQNGSTATVTTTGFNLMNAFVGKVIVDDAANDSDNLGVATFENITNWGDFENKFRGWGVDGSIFPEDDHDEECYSNGEVCRIWDWSLSTADNNLRNVLADPDDADPFPDGNDTLTHTWDGKDHINQIVFSTPPSPTVDTAGCRNAIRANGPPYIFYSGTKMACVGGPIDQAECSAAFPGSTFDPALLECTFDPVSQADCAARITGSSFIGGECKTTFLKNASEIMNDGIGDENGLCNSNETCLFTPNLGHYQGHGNLVAVSTIGSGGTLENIKLMQYDTNGRPAQEFYPTASTKVIDFVDNSVDVCVDNRSYSQGFVFPSEVTMLDCTEEGINTLVGMEVFTNLQELILKDNEALDDLTPLFGLNSLSLLDLENNTLIPMAQIVNFPGLVDVNFASMDLTDADLVHVAALTNLLELYIWDNNITDITALLSLSSLEVLEIDNNEITAVPDLSPLPALNTLDMAENLLTSLASQTGTPLLSTVDFSFNDLLPCHQLDQFEVDLPGATVTRPSSCVPLLSALSLPDSELQSCLDGAGFAALATANDVLALQCEVYSIASVTDIDELYALQSLEIDGGSFSDVSPINNLTGLQNLKLKVGSLTDVSGLTALVQLVSLDVQNTGVTSISVVANYPLLQELNLDNTSLSSLSGLENRDSLTDFTLSGGTVTDLTPLGTLDSLQIVNIDGLAVTTLAPLEGLTTLTELYFDGLSLGAVDGTFNFSNWSDLQTLQIINSNFDVLTGFPSSTTLPALTFLNLDNNSITNADGLSGLNLLNSLNLSNNSITNVDALKNLSGLTIFDLRDNLLNDIDMLGAGTLTDGILIDLSGAGNNPIPCTDLTSLHGALPTSDAAGDIIDPPSCTP